MKPAPITGQKAHAGAGCLRATVARHFRSTANATRTSRPSTREIAAGDPPARLWIVPRADHVNAFAIEPERYVREVLAWLGSH